jgi:hypothetical protein
MPRARQERVRLVGIAGAALLAVAIMLGIVGFTSVGEDRPGLESPTSLDRESGRRPAT